MFDIPSTHIHTFLTSITHLYGPFLSQEQELGWSYKLSFLCVFTDFLPSVWYWSHISDEKFLQVAPKYGISSSTRVVLLC